MPPIVPADHPIDASYHPQRVSGRFQTWGEVSLYSTDLDGRSIRTRRSRSRPLIVSLSNVNVSLPQHTCGATGVPVTFRISSANGNRVKLFCAKSFYWRGWLTRFEAGLTSRRLRS